MTKPYRIITGDCFRVAKSLPHRSVHCIVTSPPYWGLRDYETEPRVWDGTKGCHHRWQRVKTHKRGHPGTRSTLAGTQTAEHSKGAVQRGAFCRKCGAWRGSFGLEPTPDLYVQHLVQLFRRLRRVLRDDGTVWLNLGDSYCPDHAQQRHTLPDGQVNWGFHGHTKGSRARDGHGPVPGLKPKDLVGIPWRVAFALQADGWYLRSDVIWSKPNPMPEAVLDRPTKAHEYLFLLSKRPKYYYDLDAIREPATTTPEEWHKKNSNWQSGTAKQQQRGATYHGYKTVRPFSGGPNPLGRNRRSVWTITTKGYAEAHFAVYPEALVAPCIQAGTSEHGCCPKCGTPWTRVVRLDEKASRDYPIYDGKDRRHRTPGSSNSLNAQRKAEPGGSTVARYIRTTTGWQAGCKCGRKRAPMPCTVLDPFNGSGTTGAVAVKLHRRYVGIELNPEYVTMATRRLRRAARTPQAQLDPLFARGAHA